MGAPRGAGGAVRRRHSGAGGAAAHFRLPAAAGGHGSQPGAGRGGSHRGTAALRPGGSISPDGRCHPGAIQATGGPAGRPARLHGAKRRPAGTGIGGGGQGPGGPCGLLAFFPPAGRRGKSAERRRLYGGERVGLGGPFPAGRHPHRQRSGGTFAAASGVGAGEPGRGRGSAPPCAAPPHPPHGPRRRRTGGGAHGLLSLRPAHLPGQRPGAVRPVRGSPAAQPGVRGKSGVRHSGRSAGIPGANHARRRWRAGGRHGGDFRTE